MERTAHHACAQAGSTAHDGSKDTRQGDKVMTNDSRDAAQPSRRRLLQALSLVAAQGSVACGQLEPDSGPSIATLRQVSMFHGRRLPDERLEAIRPTIEQQLAQLEAVRHFDLDDRVEPATVFQARR